MVTYDLIVPNCCNSQTHSNESVRSLRSRMLVAVQQHVAAQSSARTLLLAPITLDHITHLVFVKYPKDEPPITPAGASHAAGKNVTLSQSKLVGEFFKIIPCKGSPLLYKHNGNSKDKCSNANKYSDNSINERRGSQAAEHTSDSTEDDEEAARRVQVACGEVENSLLWELDIEESCELRLKINSNVKLSSSSASKEVTFAESWNELPGPGLYADISSTTKPEDMLAVVPFVSSPNKTIRSDNSSLIAEPSTSFSKRDDNCVPTFSTSDNKENSSPWSTGNTLQGMFPRNSQSTAAVAGADDPSDALLTSMSAGATPASRTDLEKHLPGLLLAEKGSEVFEILFKLGQLEDKR